MKVIVYDGKNHFDGYDINHNPVFNRCHCVGKPVRSLKEFIVVFKAAQHPRIKLIK